VEADFLDETCNLPACVGGYGKHGRLPRQTHASVRFFDFRFFRYAAKLTLGVDEGLVWSFMNAMLR
jgi:hypothetical protein